MFINNFKGGVYENLSRLRLGTGWLLNGLRSVGKHIPLAQSVNNFDQKNGEVTCNMILMYDGAVL